jgi:aspartyl-tRNA(Asn)/glutamyl-tRNA(Gln) amidotransferase subunit A
MSAPAAADPCAWTLTQAVEAIRQGEIASETLTGLCLDRVEALQSLLNAFIAVDKEDACAAARAADAHQASGAPLGPLHGAPLAHKDMFYRAGRITGCGSRIRRDAVMTGTATVLQRLDAAGALDLGLLNMAEFALGATGHNAHYGRVANPWRTDVITGGSSSGSAAAVAAGMIFGALGSDTGGSIRMPAAFRGGLIWTRWLSARAGGRSSSMRSNTAMSFICRFCRWSRQRPRRWMWIAARRWTA